MSRHAVYTARRRRRLFAPNEATRNGKRAITAPTGGAVRGVASVFGDEFFSANGVCEIDRFKAVVYARRLFTIIIIIIIAIVLSPLSPAGSTPVSVHCNLYVMHAQYTPPTPTRRNCFVASASAVCIGHYAVLQSTQSMCTMAKFTFLPRDATHCSVFVK